MCNLLFCILVTINIDTFTAIVGGVVGLITIGAIIFKGGSKFGKINESLDNIKATINNDIKPHVQTIPVINDRVETLWTERVSQSNSPTVLNEKGEKILRESKIDEVLNLHYDTIVKNIQSREPKNAYQAQIFLIDTVKDLKNNEICREKLELAAFNSGVDTDTILYVGAIHIRDKVIQDLRFKLEDLDKHNK